MTDTRDQETATASPGYASEKYAPSSPQSEWSGSTSKELRDQIDRTRAEMDTFDALEKEADPLRKATDSLHSLLDDPVALSQEAFEIAKRYPLPAAAIVLGLGWLVTEMRRPASREGLQPIGSTANTHHPDPGHGRLDSPAHTEERPYENSARRGPLRNLGTARSILQGETLAVGAGALALGILGGFLLGRLPGGPTTLPDDED
ncbi:MAG TPA: hypothetical protein VLQ45_35235 [Thermoanaerobaculia bacterium]|nr:hypothetical protein [Thermoanaerobaculia bacterium]